MALHLRLCHRLHLVERLVEPVGLDRLHQVVDSVHIECLEGILAVGGHEDDRRRILELVQGLCKLHAGCLRHRDIEEHHVRTSLHELLDRFAGARGLRNAIDPASLLQQVLELRTCRSLVVHNHCPEHRHETSHIRFSASTIANICPEQVMHYASFIPGAPLS